MDLFDIVRADGGSIAPVIIFIIWVLFSIIGNAQTKKKKRMLAEKRRQEEEERQRARQQEAEELPLEEPVEVGPTVSPEAESGNDATDIEQDFETIFGAPEPAEQDASVPVETSVPGESEPFSYDTQSALPQPAVVESPTAAEEPLSVFASTAREHPSVPDDLAAADAQGGSLPVDISSIDEVRKGVVWSEVLGPCKGLQEP